MNEEAGKKEWYKRWYVLVLVAVGFIWSVGSSFGGSSGSSSSTPTPTPAPVTTASEPSMSKEQAQKELDDFMATAKKAKLVTSYDFSKLNETVYRWDIFVGSSWYLMTVQQKKDFIAYIGIHKKAITGYSHFELHDAYSNEKVGEITSFTSSIEVYK